MNIQGLRQGCVLAPMLFNMLFTAVLRVAEKRFLADAAITDNMVQLQRMKEEGEKKGTSRTGKLDGRGRKEEEMQRLCGKGEGQGGRGEGGRGKGGRPAQETEIWVWPSSS